MCHYPLFYLTYRYLYSFLQSLPKSPVSINLKSFLNEQHEIIDTCSWKGTWRSPNPTRKFYRPGHQAQRSKSTRTQSLKLTEALGHALRLPYSLARALCTKTHCHSFVCRLIHLLSRVWPCRGTSVGFDAPRIVPCSSSLFLLDNCPCPMSHGELTSVLPTPPDP